MAAQQDQNLNFVYTLGVKPGVKRDGTIFESREFTDGVWCRFQRGVPKKIGGYLQMYRDWTGIARGMIATSFNGVNYIFTGNQFALIAATSATSLGVGNGPYSAVIKVGYDERTLVSVATPSFVVAGDHTDIYTAGTKVVFSQTPGAPQYIVSSSSYTAPNTTVTLTTAIPGAPTKVWVADYYFQQSELNTWQFDIQYDPQGDALKCLAHPGLNLANIDNGIATQVLVGNVLPDTNYTWNFEGLADTAGANPTGAPIVVDGGVCVLYPFIFVYGSNGFIANNNVDPVQADRSVFDWNGPLANRNNMTAGKIVKGMPVRGGTNSPSGLFWATDSLIRVSFTGNPEQYWKYDIISSQTSILSSNSVVEMDGVYYWMGVDRFYAYNGSVQVMPNDKNINWVYDNLNFNQRQKVWATKVPRYNEVWFFYPRGNATECTDAIIYNVKDKLWYDAGQAEGARRSCGYTTEVFPSPVWCGWEYKDTIITPYFWTDDVVAPLLPPGPNQVYVQGDATPGIFPRRNVQFTAEFGAPFYRTTAATYYPDQNVTLITFSDNVPIGLVFNDPVYPVSNGVTVWQHEWSLNEADDDGVRSIYSSFDTCDISWVGGDPSQDAPRGINRRIHLRRIEPDFVQAGDMTLQVLGRKFARGEEQASAEFTFGPDTGKIDLRIENRESRLRFVSNVMDGNYEMGRVLVTAEFGDERP